MFQLPMKNPNTSFFIMDPTKAKKKKNYLQDVIILIFHKIKLQLQSDVCTIRTQ